MSKECIKLKIENKSDNISLVRLLSSSVGRKIGLSIDDIEDLKVAVGEACILVFSSEGDELVEIEYTIDENKLEITLCPRTDYNQKEETKEIQMGRMIIESLMDEAYYQPNKIKLVKSIN